MKKTDYMVDSIYCIYGKVHCVPDALFQETRFWDCSRDEAWAWASRGGCSAAWDGEIPRADPIPAGAWASARGAGTEEAASLRGVPQGETHDRRDRPQDLRGGPEVSRTGSLSPQLSPLQGLVTVPHLLVIGDRL